MLPLLLFVEPIKIQPLQTLENLPDHQYLPLSSFAELFRSEKSTKLNNNVYYVSQQIIILRMGD